MSAAPAAIAISCFPPTAGRVSQHRRYRQNAAVAYDEELAEQVRELLGDRAGVSERRMFGGIGFMIEGNMAVGVMEDQLIVRLDPPDAERALAEPGVRKFDFT